MSSKNNIPVIRFRGFSGEWEETTLKDCCIIKTGFPFDSSIYSSDGKYLVITNGNIQDDLSNVDITLGNKINTIKNNILKEYLLNIGDILVTMDGTVGRIAKVAHNNLILAQRVGRLVPNCNNEFLYSTLETGVFFDCMATIAHGGTIKHISLSEIGDFKFRITDINEEQQAIGKYFKNIDHLITQSTKRLEKLKNLKKAYLEKMFPRGGATTPELRFKGFSEEWSCKALGMIGNPFTGLSGKTKVDFGHGEAVYITYMNVFSNPISNIKEVDKIEIDNNQNKVIFGDVLFTTSSETPEEVGMSSVWLGNEGNVYLNSFCFGYRPEIDIDPYYFAYLLRSSVLRQKISFLAQGISRYNISKNRVMEIEIAIPILNEQQKIGNFFRNIDEQIAKQTEKLDKLKNIKKACLDKMFI